MRIISSTRSVTGKLIAQRTCVACRQIRAKRELIRIVRTPSGDIEFDITGKKEGRGAYLCPTQDCLETALKNNRLEHSLRGRLTRQNLEKLVIISQELLKGVN